VSKVLILRKWAALICIFLIASSISIPKIYAQPERYLYAQVDITDHAPESEILHEKDIPGEKSSSKWLWILLGVVAIAGGGAALAGGSGSDDSNGGSGGSGSDAPAPTTGGGTVSW